MSQQVTPKTPATTNLVSKAPKLGEDTEQWVKTMKFSCVHCKATFETRRDLVSHYDNSRHDKYSAWK